MYDGDMTKPFGMSNGRALSALFFPAALYWVSRRVLCDNEA